jgi:ABC-type sugar transport system substrate-binding protein
LVVASAFLLAACGSDNKSSSGGSSGSGSSSSKKPGEDKQIGLMVWTSAPYYEVVIAGAKDEASKLGAKLTVANAQGNSSREVSIIQQYISQRKDAIIPIASNSKGIVPVIRQVNQANIPVIASQTAIDPAAKTLTYVGADNVEYGRRLADATAQAIGGKGNVAMILGQLGSSPQIDRKEGFVKQIQAKYPGIKLVAEQTASWDYDKALKVGQDFLSRYPKGKLAAVVDEGPEGVTAAKYAQKAGRTDVKWILGDVPTEVSKALQDGVVSAAVYQNPFQQGALAARDAVLAASGQTDKIPNPHLTKILIVTKKNLRDVNPYNY